MRSKPLESPKIVQRCAYCRSEIVLPNGLPATPTMACAGCGRDNLSAVMRLLLKR